MKFIWLSSKDYKTIRSPLVGKSFTSCFIYNRNDSRKGLFIRVWRLGVHI